MPSTSDREWRLFVQDILIEADVIASALENRSAHEALEEPLTQRALLHALQTIGEASGKLPQAVLDDLADIPWAAIRTTRNVIVHGYFGINFDIIADVLATHVPTLAERLRLYLDSGSSA